MIWQLPPPPIWLTCTSVKDDIGCCWESVVCGSRGGDNGDGGGGGGGGGDGPGPLPEEDS